LGVDRKTPRCKLLALWAAVQEEAAAAAAAAGSESSSVERGKRPSDIMMMTP
jgi:hypothetical protein